MGATYTMTSGRRCSVIANQAGNTQLLGSNPGDRDNVNASAGLTRHITFTTSAPASAIYNTNFTVAATGGASGNAVTFHQRQTMQQCRAQPTS